jgi:transcriptional regulator with XRE-family HTH domain
MESLGERLRRLRRDQGLNVVDLAAKVGVAEGTLRQIENGSVKSPSFLLGCRLANALSVDPMYLALGGQESTRDRMDDLDRRLRKVERFIAEQPKRR